MNSRFDAANADDCNIDELERSVRENGFMVLENAISAETLDALKGELDPYFRQAHDGHDDFMGHHTIRFGALLEKSQAVQDLILHPSVLGLADRILLPYSLTYHLHYTGVMQLLPGENAQVLHRDTGIFPVANPSPPLTMATMWALDDFNRENGGTVVVPGSHLWADERNPTKSEIMYTDMPAGSVLLYTGNVIHGGGNNLSQRPRTGLAIHYGMGWLRQEENQYLACSPETARKLPPEIQKLLGYELAAPSFGFVDHIHPLDYLNGVRDPAESNVATEGQRDKAAELIQLSISETQRERSRFYEPE